MDAVSGTIFDGVPPKTRVVVELVYLSGYFIVLY
jgi:hypothetical protein